VADDSTQLTLDTLALCAMDYRFNSFYKDEMHPFVSAMLGFLSQGNLRSRRSPYMTAFYRAEDKQFVADIEYMRNLSREIVEKRIRNPQEGKRDLINAMILGRDPKTGQKLSEDTVIDNMITFLIAGHETTSGLLSFLFYYLLKIPEAYRKAQEEVDRIVGRNNVIEARHINEMPYITACLRKANLPLLRTFQMEEVLTTRFRPYACSRQRLPTESLHAPTRARWSEANTTSSQARPLTSCSMQSIPIPPCMEKTQMNGVPSVCLTRISISFLQELGKPLGREPGHASGVHLHGKRLCLLLP
jgi:hypothetical protein